MTISDVKGASWTVSEFSGISENYITKCGLYTLVGGNGVFGTTAMMSRTYISLSR